MPRVKDELQELAGSLGFEVHYGTRKIWVNRVLLGGRFSKSFFDKGEGGLSLRKKVSEWLQMWAPIFGALDSPATEESSHAQALSMGFKEIK